MRVWVLSLLVVLTSTVIGLQSCRPLVRQEPVNEAERAVSPSGLQVFATKGKERGFCMVKSKIGGDDKDIELLTTEGSLNDKQLERILNSLGIWEQAMVYVDYLVMATTIGATAGAMIASAPLATLIAPVALFGVAQGSLVLTIQQRDKRMRKVISDREEQVFNDKKMQKFIDRLRTAEPIHEGGCDHVKSKFKTAATPAN